MGNGETTKTTEKEGQAGATRVRATIKTPIVEGLAPGAGNPQGMVPRKRKFPAGRPIATGGTAHWGGPSGKSGAAGKIGAVAQDDAEDQGGTAGKGGTEGGTGELTTAITVTGGRGLTGAERDLEYRAKRHRGEVMDVRYGSPPFTVE